MVENNLYISITKTRITHQDRHHPIHMEDYFLIHKWKPTDLQYAMYTKAELMYIHRSFRHPTVHVTMNLLNDVSPESLPAETRSSLQGIYEDCSICKKTARKPRHFKLAIGTQALRFNHHVQVDIMFLHGRPVVHMVYEATHFTAAKFIRKQSTAAIWREI